MSSLFYTRGWEIPEKRLFSKIKVVDHIFYVFTDAIGPFGLFESQFRFENRSPELKNKKRISYGDFFTRSYIHWKRGRKWSVNKSLLFPVFANIDAQVMRICMLTVGLTGSNDWDCLLTGMKPLMYSEREATVRGLGWKRAGTHISYCKTSLFKSLSLHRENVYHTLTFHIVSYVL